MKKSQCSKVSVIIPLYNQKDYIADAINSVLNQSHPNIEIIVINDGSTDNPETILCKFKNKIILINQENKGTSAAKNTGIKASEGQFIQFLDADDILYKNKIEIQLNYSSSHHLNNHYVSYCEIAQFNNFTNNYFLRYIGYIKDIFSSYYNFWNRYPTLIHSLLFNKNIFEDFGLFNEELYVNEDRLYFSKLSLSGVKFSYIPLIGGFRRLHSNNINKNREHVYQNSIKFYNQIHESIDDQNHYSEFYYSKYDMMCANLTYMFLLDISSGISTKNLYKLRKLLKKENIKFVFEPIPSKFKKYKSVYLLFKFLFIRYSNYFRST